MAALEKLEQRVLEVIQQDFPIASRPYAGLADKLNSTEDEVFGVVQSLCKKGIIRRLGGSFDSRKVGYKSTLAALSVPDNRLEEAVEIVNSYAGVTHNYEREGKYNVWFTIIAPSDEDIERTIEEIKTRTGAPVLNLPAPRVFKIKVDFDLGNNDE
ncbi:MAG: Lrp/AsnC family transcriptional regulator [Candidatus Abyssubacteria bacterium]|nr:Lrp/AsnC family transcriptional regulator [Candidatus Abyssubacteria bacterium]